MINKKYLGAVALLVSFSLFVAYRFHIASNSPLKTTSQSPLSLPENKIDIGFSALTLAKEIYPDISVTSYSARIDALADEVHHLAKGSRDPEQRIRCLNTVLFHHEKFQAKRDVSQRKPEDYYLNHLLDTKQGNCFSLPLLYVAVGQRLGWPIYLVHVPDHAFVRYVDPALKEQNIEATSGGGYVPDEKYAKDFRVSDTGRESGAYLRTLTYRELVGDLMAINAITLEHQGQLQKAMNDLQVAVALNPRSVGAWSNLSNASRIMAKRTSGPESERYKKLAASCSKRLDELGFVHPKDVPQFASNRRVLK